MTEPKTKRERAIEAAARGIAIARGWGNLPYPLGEVYAPGSQIGQCMRDAAVAIAHFECIMGSDTVTSPLTDESTGGDDPGPEGSGPGWEP